MCFYLYLLQCCPHKFESVIISDIMLVKIKSTIMSICVNIEFLINNS